MILPERCQLSDASANDKKTPLGTSRAELIPLSFLLPGGSVLCHHLTVTPEFKAFVGDSHILRKAGYKAEISSGGSRNKELRLLSIFPPRVIATTSNCF